MSRSLRSTLVLVPIILLVGASFVFGQSLRRSVRASKRAPVLDNRVSALPESGIGGTSKGEEIDPDDVTPDETYREVLRYVRGDYVDRVEDEKKLGFGAVRSMLASLDDPKTRFLDPAQRRLLFDQMNGRYAGIGATLTVVKQRRGTGASGIDQRRLAIVAPVPGGPADHAGLQPGDVITEIDGKWVIAYDPRTEPDSAADPDSAEAVTEPKQADRLNKGVSLPKALDALSTSTGRNIRLTVERAGNPQPFQVAVATGASLLEPVEYRPLDSRTGYLRITQFNDRATGLFTSALDSAKVATIVLDLRGNVGGTVTSRQTGPLASALALLGKLTGSGTVGAVTRRGGRIEPLTTNVSPAGRYRIAVLVNGGTSNLAEMVAGTLKERAGATVYGSRTFGDAVYQKLVELREGAAMTVSTGRLMTSRSSDFMGKGVSVDVPLVVGGPGVDEAARRAATG